MAEFNRRIRHADPPFPLPEDPSKRWLPEGEGRAVYQQIYLAVDGDAVRGAYTLKQQPFCFAGSVHLAAACQMPISEGIADKRYSFVGPRLLRDALRRQPMLFGLGIGSLDASITRLELAMGWDVKIVPFYFKVRHGYKFCRNIEYLRRPWPRRWALDLAAFSGAAWAGARAARVVAGRRYPDQKLVETQQVAEFSSWTDRVWEECQDRYSMTAVRDARVLNLLYPASDPRFIRLKVCERGRPIGWAVLLDTKMSHSKHFGNMRVGSIIDCLALPRDARKVMRAASGELDQRGVDLMLSNQSHPAWCRALAAAGFLQGPSNFILTISKAMSQLVDEVDPGRNGIHVNRGDGDGPIHL